MAKSLVSSQQLKTEMLQLLAERRMSTVTSRDLQLRLPLWIEERFAHQVMPERVARAWREMRDPEGLEGAESSRVVICSVEEFKGDNGLTYNRWTIEKVKSNGYWADWSQYVN